MHGGLESLHFAYIPNDRAGWKHLVHHPAIAGFVAYPQEPMILRSEVSTSARARHTGET